MRIAIFDDRYAEVYGAQENALLLARQCKQAGHQVTFLTTQEGALAAEARRRELNIQVVRAPDRLLRFERELLVGGPIEALKTVRSIWQYSWRLHRTLRAHRVDVVVASAVRPALLLSVTGLRRRPRLILWAQNSTPLGLLAAIAGLASWRIGLIAEGASSTFGDAARLALRRKFRPMRSGRDFSAFDVPSENKPRHGRFEVLTICSITPRKGVHHLIASLRTAGLPEAHLTVVGGTTGPKSRSYLEELKQQALDGGVDVDFVGWQDDVVPYLSAADVFVLASDNEGLPGVLLEAMASGTACITTRAGGSGELIRECGAGLTVDVGDRAGLTDALRTLAANPGSRERFSQSGFENVRVRYGLDAAFHEFASILDEVEWREHE